jgi:putative ABC transport system substrate-binding protein
MASELVRRQVAVIVVSGVPAFSAVKAATTTTPIVFIVGQDPVALGLVASLARPGGTTTGFNFFGAELAAKRMELLRELVPAITRVAVLVNPANATTSEATLRGAESAARLMGLQIQVFNASSSGEINAAFVGLSRVRPDALFVDPDSFLSSRRVQMVHLATHHAIPAIYGARAFVEAGGLMSYGADLADAYRWVGAYTGRILKGTSAADLPVVQANKFELVINAQAVKLLGLTVPPVLLARADEVIE